MKPIHEILTMTYYHQFGVPATALRLTAVVGTHGRGGGRGYREMAEQLAEGKRVQVPHFSAEELCHYVDLRDVARMHAVLAEHPAAVGQIFLCAGPKPVTGTEFVEAIHRVAPGIQVEFGFPWSMAQGEQIAFSMKKDKELLGFEPKYTLEDSIRSLVDWINAGGLIEENTAKEKAYGSGVKQG